jgi:organic radical activating enzyme
MEINNSWIDYPDNESIAVILYFSGCNNTCEDCHNFQFMKKTDFNLDVNLLISNIKEKAASLKTKKIVFSGGDPLYQKNAALTKILLQQLNDYDICIYTGYGIETVKEFEVTGFKFVKCGKYEKQLRQASEKTDKYIQFASTNQKLYDSNLTLLSKDGRYIFPKN